MPPHVCLHDSHLGSLMSHSVTGCRHAVFEAFVLGKSMNPDKFGWPSKQDVSQLTGYHGPAGPWTTAASFAISGKQQNFRAGKLHDQTLLHASQATFLRSLRLLQFDGAMPVCVCSRGAAGDWVCDRRGEVCCVRVCAERGVVCS